MDSLADLLPTVATKGVPEATKTGYQVRGIASRIKELALILMAGLGDDMASTDDLVRQLTMTD